MIRETPRERAGRAGDRATGDWLPTELVDDFIAVVAQIIEDTEEMSLPKEPTVEMNIAGARSIGSTIGDPNHTQRSKACWDAMITAAPVYRNSR